ncbi:MAG: hypothetical protein Q4F26_01570 [Atopococcus tabaci]|uniref:VanZ-like domain-containing protein n=1 Tax=Atopococcus tabaci TaxID=269774 RepID=A0AA43U7C1_9LACT|nr:hypothetical protein [Atopococcus tabaci]
MKKTENIYSGLALILMVFLAWTYLTGRLEEQNFLLIEQYFDREWLRTLLSRIQFSYTDQMISVDNLGYSQFIKFIITKLYDFSVFLLLSFLWSRGLRIRLKSSVMAALLSFIITIGFVSILELYAAFQGQFLAGDFILKSYGTLTGIILAELNKIK